MDYVSYTLLFRVNEEKVPPDELESLASEVESELRMDRPWETSNLDMKASPTIVPYKPADCEEHRVLCLRCEVYLSLIQEGHGEMGILAAGMLLGSAVRSRHDLIETVSVNITYHRVGSDPFSTICRTAEAPARHR